MKAIVTIWPPNTAGNFLWSAVVSWGSRAKVRCIVRPPGTEYRTADGALKAAVRCLQRLCVGLTNIEIDVRPGSDAQSGGRRGGR